MSIEQGPDLVLLVSSLSTWVVSKLSDGGYPGLTGGAILLGRQHVYEQTPPPRIIFTPTGSVFSGADVSSRQVKVSGAYTTEGKFQLGSRSILTEQIEFEVRCWGVANVNDFTTQRDQDYNATRVLYHAVIQGISDALGPATKGRVEFTSGKWSDVSQQDVYGREFVFGVRIATPILEKLLPFDPATAFAPSDVGFNGGVTLILPSGDSELATNVHFP